VRIKAITAILYLLSIFCFSDVSGSDWVPFQLTKTNDVWYYNSKTINYPSKDSAEVLTKTIYTDEGKRRRLVTAGMSEGEQKRQGYDKFKWSITLWEIRCNSKKIRPLNTTDYNEDGGVLLSENLQGVMQDEPMVLGLILDALREEVCRKVRDNAGGKSDGGFFSW
jgi:hypothetical protein